MTDPGPVPTAGGAASDSERRLRALFEYSSLCMAVLAPDGTVLDANRAFVALAGGDPAALVGRPLWAAPFWAPGSDAPERIRAAMSGDGGGQQLAVRTGGRAAFFEFCITPVRNASGRTTLLLAEGRDVTEAKWAEHALRVSEAKFAGIVGIASDAIISIDESQSILHFNHGAEVIFGYRAEEVLGRPLELLIPERFRAVHHEHVRRFGEGAIAARRMGERAEILGLRSDGAEFPADASISRLEVGGERVYTVVLRDVSDRKKAERAQALLAQAGPLLATSLDYETTMRSITRLALPALGEWAVLYGVGRDDAVLRLELAHADEAKVPLLAELAAHPLASVPGHPVFEVIREGRPLLLEQVAAARLDAMASSERHRQLYHELGIASLMLVPLTVRGRTIGALGFYAARRGFTADDLALAREVALRAALAMDNARLYREAQDALQARDDVLAVVSHDLGNPLSAIRIGTSLLLKRRPPGEAGVSWQHLDAIRQSVAQMERLIDDLLEVKRLEAGEVALQRRPQRPASLVSETVDVLGAVAAEKGQALRAEIETGLPEIQADRQRLLQVLSNVVGNAIKFTPAGGRILVSAGGGESVVRFTVTDSGPGIPADALGRIFDRFWQASKDGRQGIGLGLAIARSIVDAHGGRIWAESEPGEGTTVIFIVPAAPPASAP